MEGQGLKTRVRQGLDHISRETGNYAQFVLPRIYGADLRGDLAGDTDFPAGETKRRAIGWARRSHTQAALKYDARFPGT